MYDPLHTCMLTKMSVAKPRFVYLQRVVLILFVGCLLACGRKNETKTVTVPLDTTVVDDDTLEVNDTTRFKQTEHAR